MTDARLNEICEVLAKPENMEKVLVDGPDEAAKAFEAAGFDFTSEELSKAVCKLDEMEKAQAKDELSEGDLEDVAGGVLGIIVAGAALGTYAYIKRKGLYIPGPGGKLIKIGGKK